MQKLTIACSRIISDARFAYALVLLLLVCMTVQFAFVYATAEQERYEGSWSGAVHYLAYLFSDFYFDPTFGHNLVKAYTTALPDKNPVEPTTKNVNPIAPTTKNVNPILPTKNNNLLPPTNDPQRLTENNSKVPSQSKFLVNSVLDFGCGIGTYLGLFRDAGVQKTVCMEPRDMGWFMRRGVTQIVADVIHDDLSTLYKEKFDLVMSVEVLEHIGREYHERVFDFLANSSNCFVAFSAAVPGQEGAGHVAAREVGDWESEFLRRGFERDLEREYSVLSSSKIFHYLQRNFMSFVRSDRKHLCTTHASHDLHHQL